MVDNNGQLSNLEPGLSFDSNAAQYLLARPAYPPELIAHILQWVEPVPAARVLDVGCGSGQATLEFASRGYQVVAIDPARNALDLLADRCTGFPRVELVHSTLEDYNGPHSMFDLIVCAQAFHWLNPDHASRKLSELLRPSGHVAVFWHMQDVLPESPQANLYALNSRHFGTYPLMNPPEYSPEFLDAMTAVLCRDGRIGNVQVSEYPWRQRYEKDMFTRLFHSWSKYATLSTPAKKLVDADLADYLDSLQGDPVISYRTCCIDAQRVAT